jgi:hypothetical protein
VLGEPVDVGPIRIGAQLDHSAAERHVVVPVLTEDGEGDAPVSSEIALAESALLSRE